MVSEQEKAQIRRRHRQRILIRGAALAFGGSALAVAGARLAGGAPWSEAPTLIAGAAVLAAAVVLVVNEKGRPDPAAQILLGSLFAVTWAAVAVVDGGPVTALALPPLLVVALAALLVPPAGGVVYGALNVVGALAWTYYEGGPPGTIASAVAVHALFGAVLFLVAVVRQWDADAFGAVTYHLHRRTQDLKRANRRMEAVMRSTWDAVVLLDEGARIIDRNRRAHAWFHDHLDVDLARGAVFTHVVPPLNSGQFLAVLHELEQRKDVQRDFTIQAKDGSKRVLELHGARDEGTTKTRYILFVRDVTAARAREAEDRKAFEHEVELRTLREQTDWQRRFLRTAGHELRTPLSPMKMQAALIRKRGTPEQARNLQILDRNIRRMENIVGDVLSVLEVQQHRVRLDPKRIDFARLVQDQAHDWTDNAREKGIALRIDSPGPVEVVADPERLSQVIDNLVSNAVKYTEAGEVAVRTWQEDTEETDGPEGGRAWFEVKDTGIGMDPKAQEQLFEPFTRIVADTRKYKGTGLGLSICKGFVEAHGGRIRAESEGLGKGSRFTFWVPVDPKDLVGADLHG